MQDSVTRCYVPAIDSMRSGGPRPLLPRAEMVAKEESIPTAEVDIEYLVAHLEEAVPDDLLRKRLHLAIATWDAAPDTEPWTEATKTRSIERRQLILGRLGIAESFFDRVNHVIPPHISRTIIISDEFKPWYTPERQASRSFYWSAYREYLLTTRGWQPDSVADLDESTTAVVERMADPLRDDAYPTRGLVVGYVQSGKTAHFTGVLGKAVDVGYRLIIVMTGTVNILREQTQRRVDKELVGRENILRGVDPGDPSDDVDYQDDPEWDEFQSHGLLPSMQNLPDIIRLTTKRDDYKSLKTGITALELEKVDKTKPLYAQENLMPCNARLIVVKKNASVLRKLLKDLKQIKGLLEQIPTIIVDDESDQASVNTSNPKSWGNGERKRTAINGLISDILAQLPRAQYVGYTATPYANVFIDPNDAQSIFPRHYLLSLSRPEGYMGVSAFHDIDSPLPPGERTYANSNELARVRGLWGDTEDEREQELANAIDAYVLTGAIKLFREAAGLGAGKFRHHTMLVHESRLRDEHSALAAQIRRLWRDAGYNGGGGLERLRTLYKSDFRPVCLARAAELGTEAGQIPAEFADVLPYVGSAVAKVVEGVGNPVVVVNSDKDLDQGSVDFDLTPVWKILVGGAKLSRGFTVEGLTISYYRRTTGAADTLMQMGRWFGFRPNYEDLVRLYIGRAEPIGRGALQIDLYEVFGAIMFDEEDFRRELERYSVVIDGVPQVRPFEIPPLVSQRVPWLRPVATNKMFNAQLSVRRSPGLPIEPVAYPEAQTQIAENYAFMVPILAAAQEPVRFSVGGTTRTFSAYVGDIVHSDLMDTLVGLHWFYDDSFQADLAYLTEAGDAGEVTTWKVVVPQLEDRSKDRDLSGVGVRSIVERVRSRYPVFHNLSEPRHRPSADRIAGCIESYGDQAADGLVLPKQGSLLLYPLVEQKGDGEKLGDPVPTSKLIIAMRLLTPPSSVAGVQPLLKFVTKTSTTQPIVSVD